MAISLDRTELARRNALLATASNERIARFIGLDSVIHELVDGLRT